MERSRLHASCQVCRCALIAGAFALAMTPAMSFADGARVAQKANPGDIVLIRNVATRPADRNPTAPGMALMVSASPNPQLNNAIQGSGSGEITDAEISALTAGLGTGTGASGQNGAQRSFNPELGQNNGGNAAAANGATTNSLTAGGAGGAASSIGEATRGIGDQVTGAISQIPMVGGGH